MHKVPSNSGFLAAKFIKMLAKLDTHLLVWDTQGNIDEFVKRYGIEQYRNKIHRGIYKATGTLHVIKAALSLFFSKNIVRKYLLFGKEPMIQRLKLLLYYQPIFSVKPDIVHFEFGTLAKDIATIKRLTAVKMSVSFRGYDLNYIGLNDSNYYSDVWNNSDGVHFLGEDLKRRAVKRGYQSAKVEALIAPAVDTDVFHRRITDNRFNNKLRIVSVGRLTWKKGFEYAVQALHLLREKGIPFEYTIIGEGDHLHAIEYTIHELGLQDQVSLAGYMSPPVLREFLLTTDVFVHPAISEGFCNSVLEAQAMGLPVICSDADGLGENVVDGETGFVVSKWDVEQLAEKLEWCYNNYEAARQMGERGIQRVHRHFKIEDQARAFVQFYCKVHETT